MVDLKKSSIEAINALPDFPSLEDIFNAIYLKAKAIAGMEDIKNGNFLTTNELIKEVKSWK